MQSTTDSSVVNGTTSETICVDVSIPADTYSVGDIVELLFRFKKTTTDSFSTIRVYVNTSVSLTGATQIATAFAFRFDYYSQVRRHLIIKASDDTELINNGADGNDDTIQWQDTPSNLDIDWSVQQYLLITIQNDASSESSRISFYRLLST